MSIATKAAVLAAAVLLSPLPATAQSSLPAEQGQSGPMSRLEQGQIRAMDFIERDVYTTEGRETGEVADLVMQDNRIVAAIVELESWLGLGERHVAIPIDRLRRTVDRIVTDMTQDELSALPEFHYRD